jgi:TolB-like protein/Tfp pilus assembly protein PilF
MSLWGEIRRRNVHRVAIAYVAAAWLLIQVAETLFPVFGLPDAAIRVVVIVLAIGFVPAVILSWIFEWTPEGFRRDSEVTAPAPAARTRRFDAAVIAMLVLAVVFFAVDKFVFDPVRDAVQLEQAAQEARTDLLADLSADRSIAVLPFVDLSDDERNQDYSDGISVEILSRLASVANLRVISRSSSFHFRDRALSIPEIAGRLGVSYVLDGSIRLIGDQVRIIPELIDARMDTQVWSESFDWESGDELRIQDEVAANIVAQLAKQLDESFVLPANPAASADPEAYDAYLLGRQLVAKRTQESVQAAVDEFRMAIEIDDDFALAHAELALAYLIGYLPITLGESDALAAPYVATALALDSGIAEAHAAAGLLAWSDSSVRALSHFERAIALKPSYSDAYTWMAHILQQSGRYSDAFKARQEAVRQDPVSIPAINNYIELLVQRGYFDEAERQLSRLSALHPGLAAAQEGRRRSIGGNWSEFSLGLLEAMRLAGSDSPPPVNFAWSLSLLGLSKEVSVLLDPPRPRFSMMLGHHDDAVSAARHFLEESPGDLERKAILGHALAAAGYLDDAAPYFEEVWADIRQNDAASLWGDRGAAIVASHRQAGQTKDVEAMIELIQENARRMRVAGINTTAMDMSVDYEEGVAEYLSGNMAAAIELIGKAVDEGFFLYNNRNYMPDLYAHPQFQRIVSVHEERQAGERQRFLEIVCSDNAYSDIWQPADETCAEFVQH